MYSLQVVADKRIFDRFSLVFAPGILVNPNTTTLGEDPLLTIGLGGRYFLGNGYSIIADVIPIVSGFNAANSVYSMYDRVKRFDAWTIGVEKIIGDHVFQVYLTNSECIATDQCMNGGDKDIRVYDMRLDCNLSNILIVT